MTIEEEIFRRAKVNFLKLQEYGFIKEQDFYKYSKNILDNTFKIIIEVDYKGIVKGQVFDLSFNDEYTTFRVEHNTGSFVKKVRSEFESLLRDIKDKCFISEYFIYNQSNRIAKLIKEKYGDEPEFKWESSPGTATFSNKDSKKWYGIIMNIDKSKLEENTSGEVEIINIKLDPTKIKTLLTEKGFYPAYHMNKKYWITIILNDTIEDKLIMELISESYAYTVNKNKSNHEWIIPSNPKYFDIEKALTDSKTIMWKQSTDILENDIVYLYVGSPYSSIMYKFKVIKPNIPYKYSSDTVKMKKVMQIELIKKYEQGEFSFNLLKQFGVRAVRGPRYMPVELSKYINYDY